MRPIKFRAWNGEKMTRGFDLWDINYEWFPSLCLDDSGEEIMPHIQFMQYTWLKDKNGVEIWEWDIVWDGNDIVWIDNYSKVEYDEEFSWFIIYVPWLITPLHEAIEDWNTTDGSTGKNVSWVYVVGNIYESPELIK